MSAEEIKYNRLKSLVLELLNTQALYFKSKTKDYKLLVKSKALERQVREMIEPPKKPQGELWQEFLAR